MQKLRSVDKAMKWVLQAEKDDRLVPSFGAEIVGEIEAHETYAAGLCNTISLREESVRDWMKTAERLNSDLNAKNAIIAKMTAELEKHLHSSAIMVLKEVAV